MTQRSTCLPSLPAGFTAQPTWGFHDATGRLAYEFHRVYRAPAPVRHRAGIEGQVLDEDRSYWSVTWPGGGGTDIEHPAGRWITYAQARELKGRRLTFARFSTLDDMREEIPRLLEQPIPSRRATALIDVQPSPVPRVS